MGESRPPSQTTTKIKPMNPLQAAEQQFKKPAVVAVDSGDTVRVHQRIREGSRERIQIFEGLVIRVDRRQSLTYRITVRKIASGIGVEKGFMMHSPNVVQVEVIKRAKVRRNYISYIRGLRGKSARLKPRTFDPAKVNLPPEAPAAQPPADKPESAPAAEATGPPTTEPEPSTDTDSPTATAAPDPEPTPNADQDNNEADSPAEADPTPTTDQDNNEADSPATKPD